MELEIYNHKFNVESLQDEKSLVAAISNYKKKPSKTTLFEAFTKSIEWGLKKFGLDKVSFAIIDDDYTSSGNGFVTISRNAFDLAQNPQKYYILIDLVMHELCHLMLAKNNDDYLLGKAEKFYQPYYFKYADKLFNSFIYSKEVVCSARLYFYMKNINELSARKNGYALSKELCNQFGLTFPYKNFASSEEVNLGKRYPYQYYSFDTKARMVLQKLDEFQISQIKELYLLDDEELETLLFSFSISYSKNVRQTLCNELKQTTFDVAKKFLLCPNVKFELEQMQSIKSHFSNQDFTQIDKQNGKVITALQQNEELDNSLLK